MPKISKRERKCAAFTIGEARRELQDVDLDQHAHGDGTPEKESVGDKGGGSRQELSVS